MDIDATLFAEMFWFLLFVLFTMKYVWPPLQKNLQAPKEQITDDLAAAEKGQRESELVQHKNPQELEAAKLQAAQIIEQPRIAGMQCKTHALLRNKFLVIHSEICSTLAEWKYMKKSDLVMGDRVDEFITSLDKIHNRASHLRESIWMETGANPAAAITNSIDGSPGGESLYDLCDTSYNCAAKVNVSCLGPFSTNVYDSLAQIISLSLVNHQNRVKELQQQVIVPLVALQKAVQKKDDNLMRRTSQSKLFSGRWGLGGGGRGDVGAEAYNGTSSPSTCRRRIVS